MGKFVKGDVVVLPFPFSDLTSTKPRPALVLAVPEDDEIIVCQITSQTTRPGYTVTLTRGDFVMGGLDKDICYIRPNHIFLFDPKIVTRLAGKICPEKIDEVIQVAIEILKNR